jgi:hypothetical protein
MQAQFTSSSHQAKAILGAWHSGDAHRLQQELDRVHKLQPVDSGEEERLELLAEIARELPEAQRSGDSVYGSLLEHLAFAGQETSRRRAIRVSGYGRAAAAAVLQ